MKKYIKSTVVPYITLKDWVDRHQASDFERLSRIVVFDDTPYTNNYYESGYDVPGTIFCGSFDELKAGEGDIYITPDEYTHYYIEEDRPINEFNEYWVIVSNDYEFNKTNF